MVALVVAAAAGRRANTGGRGGQTLFRCKLRNIKTGAMMDRTFSGGDRVKSG